MGTYPTAPRSALYQWCKTHADIFSAHAAAIGLTPAQATAYQTLAASAGDALDKQDAAATAAKTATKECNNTFAALRESTTNLLRLIRTFAEMSGNPNAVYNVAQIPPPAQPSPVPPPAQPVNLRVELEASTGTITLRWNATNPASGGGTSYIVRRRLPDESDFSFLGVSGSKKYIDTTLLAGPDQVQYTVQGQRSGLSGPVSEIFTINFGRLPDGGRIVQNVSGGAAPAGDVQMQAADAVRAGGNGASGSTVNGQRVQKVLPQESGARARH